MTEEEEDFSVPVKINLNGHGLLSFPEDLLDDSSRPKPLHELCLSSNRISVLPATLPSLYELRVLEIAFNELSGTAPIEISELTMLKVLNLSGNSLSDVPLAYSKLCNLEEFLISHNQLQSFSSGIFTGMPKLKVLYANQNQLSSAPDDLKCLANLEDLAMSGNLLTSVPDAVYLLASLRHLSLDNNSIAEISPNIGNLTSLEMLRLDNNDIGYMPEELSLLRHLRHLSLMHNHITWLSPTLGENRTGSFVLFLGGNELSAPLQIGGSRGWCFNESDFESGAIVIDNEFDTVTGIRALGKYLDDTDTNTNEDEGKDHSSDRKQRKLIYSRDYLLRFEQLYNSRPVDMCSVESIITPAQQPHSHSSLHSQTQATHSPKHHGVSRQSIRREISAPGGLSLSMVGGGVAVRGRGRGYGYANSPRGGGRGRYRDRGNRGQNGSGSENRRRDRRFKSHDDLDTRVNLSAIEASLHHAEHAYVPLYKQRLDGGDGKGIPSSSGDGSVVILPNDESTSLRAIKSALNKLTVQTFDRLTDTIVASGLSSMHIMKTMVNILFQKSIVERGFAPMYAEMCCVLVAKSPVFEDKADFRSQLITESQHRFEDMLNLNVGSIDDTDERDIARLDLIGTVEFIGELYKCDVLTENIVHAVVGALLARPDDEYLLESLCCLLSTIGKKLERSSKETVDAYFAALQEYSDSGQYGSRATFFIIDLLDLRKAGWRPRRPNAKVKLQSVSEARAERKIEKTRKVQFQAPAKVQTSPVRHEPPQFRSQVAAHAEGEAETEGEGASVVLKPQPSEPQPKPKTVPMVERIDLAVQEYFIAQDMDDCVLCVKELINDGAVINDLIAAFANTSMDRGVAECEAVGVLLGTLAQEGVLSAASIEEGLGELFELLPDLMIDVPESPKLLSVLTACMLASDCLPIGLTLDTLMAKIDGDGDELRVAVVTETVLWMVSKKGKVWVNEACAAGQWNIHGWIGDEEAAEKVKAVFCI